MIEEDFFDSAIGNRCKDRETAHDKVMGACLIQAATKQQQIV